VALHPLIISRTDIGENPHPLVVVWTGPIVGAALPLLGFLIAKLCRAPGLYFFRFCAGFCLIANGVYIAFGPTQGGADTGVILLHGSPRWTTLLFGVLTVPPGCISGIGRARISVCRRPMAAARSYRPHFWAR